MTAADYPLAHRGGINALVSAALAARAWTRLTPHQRDVLREAHQDARATVDTARDTGRVDLPAHGPAHPLTLAALARRGLITDGHLTAAGVLVAYWQGGTT